MAGNAFLATGGIITESGGYRIHTFNSTDVLTVVSGEIDAEWVGIAGAGAGAGNSGGSSGGGGAGEVDGTEFGASTIRLTPGTYPITIGAGGAGSTSDVRGQNGGDTITPWRTLKGGGGGGASNIGGQSGGNTGGSGGGGGCNAGVGGSSSKTGTGKGNSGGAAETGGAYPAGGGGGAGSAGGSGGLWGDGGNGVATSLSGSTKRIGGGGGGAVYYYSTPSNVDAGAGLGGRMGSGSVPPTSATANTGSGGGGACSGQKGGDGASGFFQIRYPI